MKDIFVKTENQSRLLAGAEFMKNKGGKSSCLCLVHGEPGVGKTRNISHWGAGEQAVLIKGHVGMNLDGLIWTISQALGVKHKANRSAEMAEHVAALTVHPRPIVFDEAQFGLSMRWQKTDAAGIEYLRGLAESAGTYVMLVCHSSERHRFSEFAHVRTRIPHQVEMHDASVADTMTFVSKLAEVEIDDGVGELVHKQTSGRFRLIESAISSLERIGKMKGLSRLTLADVVNVTLVIDQEQHLTQKIAPKGEAKGNASKGVVR